MSSTSVDQGAPIFVLAAPRSCSALIGAMIGRNPAAFGVAELNLFVADTLEAAWLEMARHRQTQMHGLLRTVAQLYAGEQSLAALAMARRWAMRRLHWPTRRVFDEIRSRVAPFRLVEKSRAHLRDAECLARIAEACADACYVHVVRHPLAQGTAMAIEGEDDAALIRPVGALRPSREEDPEELWAAVEDRIAAFLADVPADRQVRVRAEALLSRPTGELAALAAALGLPADADAVSVMLHPEESPFAMHGPIGANFGDDLQFLRSPHFRRRSIDVPTLDEPLPWRRDGACLSPEIARRARALGYR
jgi:Sulfotransferase family